MTRLCSIRTEEFIRLEVDDVVYEMPYQEFLLNSRVINGRLAEPAEPITQAEMDVSKSLTKDVTSATRHFNACNLIDDAIAKLGREASLIKHVR